MQEALALNPWTFMLMSLMWFAAYMTGQGLANTWRPAWQTGTGTRPRPT